MTLDIERIKAAWIDGDRVTAFTLYLMDSYPKTWVRYVSQAPEMEAQLNALSSIEAFKMLLPDLVRRVNSGQVAVTRLPWRGHSNQPDDPPFLLHRSAAA